MNIVCDNMPINKDALDPWNNIVNYAKETDTEKKVYSYLMH